MYSHHSWAIAILSLDHSWGLFLPSSPSFSSLLIAPSFTAKLVASSVPLLPSLKSFEKSAPHLPSPPTLSTFRTTASLPAGVAYLVACPLFFPTSSPSFFRPHIDSLTSFRLPSHLGVPPVPSSTVSPVHLPLFSTIFPTDRCLSAARVGGASRAFCFAGNTVYQEFLSCVTSFSSYRRPWWSVLATLEVKDHQTLSQEAPKDDIYITHSSISPALCGRRSPLQPPSTSRLRLVALPTCIYCPLIYLG